MHALKQMNRFCRKKYAAREFVLCGCKACKAFNEANK